MFYARINKIKIFNNREEHYPHGTRDKEDVPDTTGNIRVDYTVFGFEEEISL